MSRSTLPQGFSEAARIVADASRRNHRRLADSVTFTKQPAYDELGEVWNDCHTPNWDAHGAEPVERETLRNTYLFIEALPYGYALPSVGSEPDGHLTLEWYRATNWMLSVSMSPEGVLYYAALLGDEDPLEEPHAGASGRLRGPGIQSTAAGF